MIQRIKVFLLVSFLSHAAVVMPATINHDISLGNLSILGTSTDDYVITGNTTTHYVDIAEGYRGTIVLKNCTINLTNNTTSSIRVHGKDNQSNLSPVTIVNIVLDGNNRLYNRGNNGYSALQVDQGAQINISAVNPYDNSSGVLEAIVGTSSGGAGIGALCSSSDESKGSEPSSCGGTVTTAGGNIVISSGTITARGGHGAGIGGGYNTYYDGMIVIYGGVIDSRAGRHAAGIGSGCPNGNGVISCYTPNSAIIALPPASITAFGADGSYENYISSLALAGANNITYIGDPEKPEVIVHTIDYEPNAKIYVDLSRNPSIANVVNTIVPLGNLDINQVNFGQTDEAGLYTFNGILNDSTTFFTDANSSQPATYGRPYLPEVTTLPNGGEVILQLLETEMSLLPFPSTPLNEGYSQQEAFLNAYKVRLFYNDNLEMTDVLFDLANDVSSDFISPRFFKTDSTEITAPNKFVKGDTIDIIVPIKNSKLIGSYSDVLRIVGQWNGRSTGYIRQVVNQLVVKSINKTICDNDSVLFNNEYRTESGIYLDTLQNIHGLDSILLLNLKVYPTFNDTIYRNICADDSIAFGNKYYSRQGIYTNNFKTILGCDSLSSLNLTVHPTFNDTIYRNICTGDSLLFGSKYYSLQGIYTDSLRNILGCDSLSSLNLTVHPTFNDTIYRNICNGDSLLFGSKYYSHQGIYTDSLKSIFGCDSVSSLNLTIYPTFNDTIYRNICAADSLLFGSKYYSLQGIYTDSLKTVLGCDSLSSLNLTINPTFNDTIYRNICADDSIAFGNKYYSRQGIYTDSLKTIFGCDSLSSLHLTTYPIFNDTICRNICTGDSLIFGSKYYSLQGIYTDSLKTIFGCDSLSSLNLTIYSTFNDTIYRNICNGDSLLFGSKYYSLQGIYTDSLKTVLGCDSLSSLNLTVYPTFNDTIYRNICTGDSLLFGSKYYSLQGIYTDSLRNIFGCDSLSSLNLTIYPTFNDTIYRNICTGDSLLFGSKHYSLQGIYTDSLKTIFGCDSLSSLNLTTYPIFNDTIYRNICAGDSILFGNKYYSRQGIYTDSLKSIFGCDSLSTLNLVKYSSYYMNIEDSIFQNESYKKHGFDLPEQYNHGEFNYERELNTVFGCDSIVNLHLTVYPIFEARIQEMNDICADASDFEIEIEEIYGKIDYYSLNFDNESLNIDFPSVNKHPFTNKIRIDLPKNTRPNYYKMIITLENIEGYKQSFPMKFMVKYPSSVMAQKWNDVVALYNSSYNGGYDYSKIQWYRNGEKLHGETHSYIYLENSLFSVGDEYSALLTRIDDGVEIFTCPLIVDIRPERVQAFPSLLSIGEPIYLTYTEKDVKVSIFNSLGRIISEKEIKNGNNTITTFNELGVYHIIIWNDDEILNKQTIIVQ